MRHQRRRADARNSRGAVAERAIHPAARQTPAVARKELLLGTALASTLLLGATVAPLPAYAVRACVQPTAPNPIIDVSAVDAITCINTEPRTNPNGDAIDISTVGDGLFISLTSSGELMASNGIGDAAGIDLKTNGTNSAITVDNTGGITSTSFGLNDDALGIRAETDGARSNITIENAGKIDARANGAGNADAFGIRGRAQDGVVTITNTGNIEARGRRSAFGIDSRAIAVGNEIAIDNAGDIIAAATEFDAYGIRTNTFGSDSSTLIKNSGDITVSSIGDDAIGIDASSFEPNSSIVVHNSGNIAATARDNEAIGITADAFEDNSRITINNSGRIAAVATETGDNAYGIRVGAFGTGSAATVKNSGDIDAASSNGLAYGISVRADARIRIENAGSIYAAGPDTGVVGQGSVGLFARTNSASSVTVINTGKIGASSDLAISVAGAGTAQVFNAGTVTGYVILTDQNDLFINQSGGVFEARQTSEFNDGNDLLLNQAGGTVQAANDAAAATHTRFVGLETFRNRGLISMIDGQAGDRFTISNTLGGTNLNFQGGGTLGLDVFLDGPTSPADVFTIEGNVSGVTTLVVNNTNPGGGTFNPQGIPVIFATGNTPNPNGFFLPQPIDTGFVDYDLFFVNTGSGFWELRSFVGGGAHLLPQLATAAQDIWHQGSNTWFDRTADLRVSLAGGAAPTAYNPNGGTSLEANGAYPLTPAVWARGSGGWLDRDDNARTTAYGRNYTFDLDRDLETIDFQVGIDMGSYDVFGQGDALVFGVLGGFVHGNLDYDAIVRSFNFNGGQVGAYATYLNGGLFVDTLLNVHLYELSTATRGFPSSLNANTVGLRTDTGYRFGSFTGGAFLEPLATIEVMWADIDGFSLGGNTVSFNDEANVRGRLGLRAGTTMNAWEGTLMEPFVIGSLWSNLSDNNAATLVSNGTTFRFNDELEDVWGEISAGVNFFNLSQTTAVFAKLDVTLGDDVSGVGGKAGMRVNW